MAVQIQYRRDTAANWTSVDPILAEGEIGLEKDTKKYKMGNGTQAWTALGYGVGTQGPQGNQGNQGAVGAQGTQGNQGNQGVVGAQGTQGTQGNQGTQGSTGSTGPQGNQGNQGNQGTQGNQGNQGIQGSTGTQGNQGNQGNQGVVGAQGTQGVQGATGTQGNQGNQGNQGAVGAQGTQGSQGTQGVQGATGSQGATGPQGTQGNQGTQGTQGAQGNQGNQGAVGAQGNQGNQGIQGTQGAGNLTYFSVQGNQVTCDAQTVTDIFDPISVSPGTTYAYRAVIGMGTVTGTQGVQMGIQCDVNGATVEGKVSGPQGPTADKSYRQAAQGSGILPIQNSPSVQGVVLEGIIITPAGSPTIGVQAKGVQASVVWYAKPNCFLQLTKTS